MPASTDGFASATLTIATTWGKHCIHWNPLGVTGTGNRCPYEVTCQCHPALPRETVVKERRLACRTTRNLLCWSVESDVFRGIVAVPAVAVRVAVQPLQVAAFSRRS